MMLLPYAFVKVASILTHAEALVGCELWFNAISPNDYVFEEIYLINKLKFQD